MKTMKIIKRSGEEKEFDIVKIENAIRKASQAVDYKNALSEGRIKLIAEEVAGVCAARDRAMTVEEIQDVVENKIMEMLPKQMIILIVPTEKVEKIEDVVKKCLYTGHIGDGKIFVSEVTDVVRVRTGEDGADALV